MKTLVCLISLLLIAAIDAQEREAGPNDIQEQFLLDDDPLLLQQQQNAQGDDGDDPQAPIQQPPDEYDQMPLPGLDELIRDSDALSKDELGPASGSAVRDAIDQEAEALLQSGMQDDPQQGDHDPEGEELIDSVGVRDSSIIIFNTDDFDEEYDDVDGEAPLRYRAI